MKGSQAGSGNLTELSIRKTRSLLFYGLLLSVVALTTAVLNGCAGIATANNSSQPPSQAAIQVTPSSVSFGNVVTGKKISQTVSVANTGNIAVNISQVNVSSSQFSVSGLAMPLSLPVGQSNSFQVWFDATAAGNATGTLTVRTDTGVTSGQVALAGSATAAPQQIGVSPTSLNLGSVTVGTTASGTVTINNVGGSNLTISSISGSGNPFTVSGLATPSTIAPGASSSFNVSYSPTAAVSSSGSVTITSDDPVTHTSVVTVSGTGTATAVPPTITTQPAGQTVTAGQTATFAVVAAGTATLTYQWRKNGVGIFGATSSSYTTPATTTSDSGSTFTVVVTNSVGTVTSAAATLTVNAAPVAPTISTQPASQTVTAGQTATFSIVASGTAPLSYQWQKNGVNIAGATASSYTTPATATSDSGSAFTVVVTNTAGAVTSAAATLTVNAAPVAPTITTQPVSQTVTAGQTATFAVVATGTAPLNYQWRKNGVNIAGANSSSYTTPATATSDSGSAFTVVVTNTAGSVTSAAGTLTVNAAPVAPTITTQPASQTVTAGQTATFAVVATGTAPLNYQWQKNGVNIAGAMLSSYTTPATTSSDSGSTFTVVATNSVGTAASAAATLTVTAAPVAPTITTQPVSQTVTAGQTAIFAVVATGTAPLNYQWRKNGVNIAGATASSYTTPATATSDSGSAFTVVVTNTAGTVTSGAATLTVNAAPVAPTITTQPVSQTVTAGQTATFAVVAGGTAPLSYQWQKNGVNIGGATATSYTTPATTTSDSGSAFAVVVTNSAGTVTSAAATLTVSPAPVAPTITTQPVSQTVTAGQTATFAVVARGTAPLNYQWQKNGVNIAGATSSSYTTPVTTTSDSGSAFTVVVTNTAGTVTSSAATLTVNPAPVPPTITTQPVSQTVTAGQTATFAVVASGTAPLNYQWQKNGVNIVGGTASSYTTPATATSDSGSAFTAVVTNAAGTVTSVAATLTVNVAPVAPTIGTQPVSQTVTAGQTATFTVVAAGTAPLSYQWQKNGVNIAGATSSSYTTPATATSDSGSAFAVVVTNTAGTVTSGAATLTVNTAPVAPTITTQPVSQTVTAGQTATFAVVATGTAPLSYQWQKNGVVIPGATSSSYTAPATTTSDSGSAFAVVVTNSVGTVTSAAATLTVNAAPVAPTIPTQPVSQTVTAGQTATFTVVASGTAPLNYQWQKNGVNIAGATATSYTTPAATTSDSGSTFTVVVTNSVGTVTSSAATLTVNAAPVAPTITTQPVSQTVTAGQTATFAVVAAGTAPLNYQWQKNGVNIAGATAASYTTPATTTSDSGSTFSVVVTNSVGTVTSAAATLTVNPAPVAPTITTQPVSQTVTAGQTATFTVVAAGTAPLSYQWQKNGVNIAGATATSYTTPVTTTSDSGSAFTVVVTNTAGTVTSSAATLTVNPAPVPPTITTQPVSQTVTAGQTATFTVVASGTAPLSYQWRKNGVNIAGAISSSYTTPATATSDSGSAFSVVVTNSVGTVTSGAATLTVNPAPVAPTITTQPASQTVTAGQTATFAVVATGTTPLNYQWQKNGVVISGATSSSYTTPATTTSDSGSTFGVVVTNSAGTVTSAAATLTVNPAPVAPTITTQPVSQTVTAGQTATFTVVAAGTAPLSYQWQKNGVNIAGATSSSYTTPATATSDSGSAFTVVVTNSAGTVTSSAATLTVNPAPVAPTISTQPASQTVTAGQTATFAVVASGTAPLSYQWQKNGVNIAGATAASYTTPATTTSDSGSAFTVVVTNTAGTVTSAAATLTVNPAPAPAIQLNPTSINFGNAVVTVNLSQALIIKNTGTAALTISQITATGSGFSVSGFSLPLNVNAGQQTTITVAFLPTVAGSASGNVSIVSNAPTSPNSVSLSGTGIAATFILSISPTSLSFGNVTTGTSSAAQTVTITNTGNSNVVISQITLSGAGYSMSGGSAPVTLTPLQTLTLSVQFDPTVAGAVSGNVSIVSNATGSPATVSLTGTGVAPVQHSVALTWNASTSTVAGYNVYRGTVSGGPYTKINSSLVAVLDYTDSTVQSGTTYYYATTAVDSSGNESTFSNEASAVIP